MDGYGKCPDCGLTVPVDADVCPYCGSRFKEKKSKLQSFKKTRS
jgi:RNA polymerase subunit RPABC4/transcription elongation factor Spt4